ncbi:MAG: hypothetical protein JWP63_1908 [Candidatus Solibacter sp.]|nr:hypothetical protein [Candidatus Solibacter sp.]
MIDHARPHVTALFEPDSTAQVRIPENRKTHFRVSQIGLAKVHTLKICPLQVRSSQLGPKQVSAYTIATSQVGLHQHSLPQIRHNARMILPPRIPLVYAAVYEQSHIAGIRHVFRRMLTS